jgi:hypothetical protein
MAPAPEAIAYEKNSVKSNAAPSAKKMNVAP